MNPNLSGNQWRPLQPQPNEFGSGNSGGQSPFQQQLSARSATTVRQITKNPQNMAQPSSNNFQGGFQNFPPNGFGGNSNNSGGNMPFGAGNGPNNGPLSPNNLSNNASTGRLQGLMSPMSPNGGGMTNII